MQQLIWYSFTQSNEEVKYSSAKEFVPYSSIHLVNSIAKELNLNGFGDQSWIPVIVHDHYHFPELFSTL